jgi:hypothetical protein
MEQPPDVFLGGECGDSTWRQDIAIPRLKEAGLTWYNPQVPVGSWFTGMAEIEAIAKDQSRQILIVIGHKTRSIASVMEAVEYVCYGTFVHLVIDDLPEGVFIDGQEVKGQDLKAANRGRAYLRNLVNRRRPHLPIHQTTAETPNPIDDAMTAIIAIANAYGLRGSSVYS